MASPTINEVKAILNATSVADSTIQNYINMAHSLVSEKLYDEDGDCMLDLTDPTQRLHDIEMNIAAHFVRVQEPSVRSESVDSLSVSYHKSGLGEGLLATEYGQNALILDTTGILRTLGKTITAEFNMLGTQPSLDGRY